MDAAPTIVAPATPPGTSALALVRLSGPAALDVLGALTPPPADGWQPRQAHLCTLCDDEGTPVDQALVTVFAAPHSYTGEDVVELSLHGNPVLVAHVVDLCRAAGARLADPGAFTRRAVLAGKLGLPEAEALSELLSAQSPRGAAQALGQLRGDLRRWAEDVRAELVERLAQLTAEIDFPEEELDLEAVERGAAALDTLAAAVAAEAERGARGRVWTRGAAVVLLGAPNVGKSTLLNRLLGAERAIVSPWAGTTRDVLEAGTTLGGVPIRLIDTAGVRATGDAIEAEGVRRSAAQAADADLVLWVQAPDATPDPALTELVASLSPGRVLRVWNKRDLAPPPAAVGVDVALSATADAALQPLVDALANRLAPPDAAVLIGTLRQERACREAAAALGAAAERRRGGYPAEIVAEEVQRAARALGALLGEVDAEQILDRVFASFCIGK